MADIDKIVKDWDVLEHNGKKIKNKVIPSGNIEKCFKQVAAFRTKTKNDDIRLK